MTDTNEQQPIDQVEETPALSPEEQLQAFLDQFGEAEINKIKNQQAEFKKFLDEADEFLTTQLREGKGHEEGVSPWVVSPDSPELNQWMNNANFVPLLVQHGKLDEAFEKEAKDLTRDLQRLQLFHMALYYPVNHQGIHEEYQKLDHQLLMVSTQYFSYQVQQAVTTIAKELIEGMIKPFTFEQLKDVIENAYKMHYDYLTFLEIETLPLTSAKEAFDMIYDKFFYDVFYKTSEEELANRRLKYAENIKEDTVEAHVDAQ